MTKIAIISDIHGNKTALEAVLEDIHAREINRIFCLGDLVGKGPRGTECIQLVRRNCERVIRGNWDVFIQEPTDNDFLQWFKDRLTDEDYNYLSSLAFHIDIEMNGQLIRFFHASPRSEFERIFPEQPIEKCLSMFENSDLMENFESNRKPDIVFYGDIHNTFLHSYKQGILCNVGSIGNSLDLTTASYVILDGTHGTNSIQFVRVDYNKQHELSIAKECGLPDLEKYHDELMYARYRN